MSDSAFFADVDRWIREAMSGGELTFGRLVARLPGVDPSIVAARLELDHARDIAARVRWVDVADEPEVEPRLPIPHPLDFDWRFTHATTAALTDELSARGASATLLGAPSLWLSMQGRLPASRLHLLDANPLLAGLSDVPEHRATIVDLLTDPVPTLAPADVVVVDPPWYPEVLAAFVWAAVPLVREGGDVWLSAPPLGTRPGVRRERDTLLEQARSYGLTLRSMRPGALRYARPPFERAAMRTAGLLHFVPNDWRQGDLFVFERSGSLAAPRTALRWRRWAERTIAGVRIRVDEAAPPLSEDPGLRSVVEGDVLRSVSRRDPVRASVRVWTSGNRVFGCDAPRRLLDILDAINGDRRLAASERSVAEALQALVEQERREYICSDDGGLLVPAPSQKRGDRTG